MPIAAQEGIDYGRHTKTHPRRCTWRVARFSMRNYAFAKVCYSAFDSTSHRLKTEAYILTATHTLTVIGLSIKQIHQLLRSGLATNQEMICSHSPAKGPLWVRRQPRKRFLRSCSRYKVSSPAAGPETLPSTGSFPVIQHSSARAFKHRFLTGPQRQTVEAAAALDVSPGATCGSPHLRTAVSQLAWTGLACNSDHPTRYGTGLPGPWDSSDSIPAAPRMIHSFPASKHVVRYA
jgi:hypothetical protein